MIHFSTRQQSKNDPFIIMMVFDRKFQPHRKFIYFVGQSIKAEDWKISKVAKGKSTIGRPKDKPHLRELNEYLDKLETLTKDFLKGKYNSITLDPSDLKRFLDDSKEDDQEKKKRQIEAEHQAELDRIAKESEFFTIWEKTISTTTNPNGTKLSVNTLKSKRQTLNKVNEYAEAKKFNPTLLNIDKTFYTAFIEYLKKPVLRADGSLTEGLSINSIGKHIKEIKAFLREAEDRDYEVNQSYRKKSFRVFKVDTFSTFLSKAELLKIYTAKVSPALEKNRDLFLLGCFTGARFSDWGQIRQANIELMDGKEVLKLRQTKTKETIHVPVATQVRMILQKYEGQPPRVISNQKMNEAIKSIAKKAELGIVVTGKDQNDKEIKVEKWTLLGTHSCRRSFATNAYLSRDLDVKSIMKCTGHRTESSFLRYLKLEGKDYALQASDSKFFNDESWIMTKAS